MGAEVVMTRSDVHKGHPEYYQDYAARLATETPNSLYVNQFGNDANPKAHEETTAPEIWEQMEHKLDAVVAGVGTGGTMTGLSRYFARVSPSVELVLADPVGSVLADYVRTGKPGHGERSWLVEGIGGDSVPAVFDLSRVKKAYTIPDAEAFKTCRDLLKKEGIIAGTSTGTLLAAALRYCRGADLRRSASSRSSATAVTSTCQSVYNDYWMLDQVFSSARSSAICAI